MSKQRTRMTDIAARAQVSTATVSRVFNGVGQVSEATRAKVLTAIDELGYERPVLELTSRLPNVGVILPADQPNFAASPITYKTPLPRLAGWPCYVHKLPALPQN